MQKIIGLAKGVTNVALNALHLNTPTRIVVALSPVFVSISGYVATLAARYLPGHPQLTSGEITSVFISGSTLAAAKILVWLHAKTRAPRPLSPILGSAAVRSFAPLELGRPQAPVGSAHVFHDIGS